MDAKEALDQIRDLRRQKGFSEEDIAKLLGLGQSGRLVYRKWENGIANPPAKFRRQFLIFIAEDLELNRAPEHFQDLWECLSQKWGWSSLSEAEKKNTISMKGEYL